MYMNLSLHNNFVSNLKICQKKFHFMILILTTLIMYRTTARTATTAPNQHRRGDSVVGDDRRWADGGGARDQGGGVVDIAVHRRRAVLRLLLLHRDGAHHLGVQRRGVPAPAPRAGPRPRRRREPAHERAHLHDVHLLVQGHHHRRSLLHVQRHLGAGLVLLLLLPPGDEGQVAGGDGGALRPRGRRYSHGAARSKKRGQWCGACKC